VPSIGSVRDGAAADAVDGIVPKFVAEPTSAQEVAETLAWAASGKLSVLTRGAGTKIGWGPPLQSIDLLLSTARLNKVVAHRHGDLTATIESGALLGDVNWTLAAHRQWIPLDPYSGDRGTIGGVVATNDSGPRRHRYGSPRDLIIGVEFARADGRLAKGGGIVVKNVAGYDMPRLMTGAFGSLGVIITATFKLYPLTASSRTLVVDLKDPHELGVLAQSILGSHLTPTALEFQTPPLRALIRFETIEAAVEQQAANAVKLIAGAGFNARSVTGVEEDEIWAQHGTPQLDGAAVKVSTLPTELAPTLTLVDRLAGGQNYSAAGRAGLGVFVVHLTGDVASQKKIISGLRDSLPLGRGSAVVMRASSDLKRELDVWGPIGDGLPLMKAVKQQFDPDGILNRGRGPGGL
jgi:glycolate dehydrogenase FAD-binding subunit